MARRTATAPPDTEAGEDLEAREDSKRKTGLDLAKALSHPLRVRILTEMNTPTRRMSPVDFASRHGEQLGTTAYHFRVLREAGCIRVVEEHQRRGATEHVYEPVKRAMAWKREWEDLGPVFRDNLAASALREGVEAVGRSIDSGKFASRQESVLAHDTFWVDEEGWQEVQTIFLRTLQDLLIATEQIEKRVRQHPERPSFLLSYLMASFESPVPGNGDGRS